MSRVTSSLLHDTLNVVALARETALARGGAAQAQRLAPVVDGLREAAAARPAQPAAASGVLAQSDFQALLAAAQSAPLQTSGAGLEKNQVAAAMSAGGMGEVDIARHLGVTREEVRLMLAGQPADVRRTVSAAAVRGRYQP